MQNITSFNLDGLKVGEEYNTLFCVAPAKINVVDSFFLGLVYTENMGMDMKLYPVHSITENPVLGQESQMRNIKLNDDSLDLKFSFKNDYFKHLNMVGKYNAYNYLEAVAALVYLNFDINEILKIDVLAPPGRMYIVKYKDNTIFIDYAHTPDAMEKVLKSVNEFKKNKVFTIFGCGGDRDKFKRSIMGNIASIYSDKVIITNDNPRT